VGDYTSAPRAKIIWGVDLSKPNGLWTSVYDANPTNSGNAYISYSLEWNSALFNRYIVVNNALDDLNTNKYIDLPVRNSNEQFLFTPSSGNDWLGFFPDPSGVNQNSVIVGRQIFGGDPLAVRINSNNPYSPNITFLGKTKVLCGDTYQNRCFSTLSNLKNGGIVGFYSTVAHLMSGQISLFSSMSNNFRDEQDLDSVTLGAGNLLKGCTIGGVDCSTDINSIEVATSQCNDPFSCGFSVTGTSVYWDDLAGWVVLKQAGRTTKRLFRVDSETKMAKEIPLGNLSVNSLEVSEKYYGNVIIQGIDYSVGITGSPFAARVTPDGQVVDYSVLPTGFDVTKIQVVEL
jgi:hypothetical protein